MKVEAGTQVRPLQTEAQQGLGRAPEARREAGRRVRQSPRGNQPYGHLEFVPPASRSVRQYISVA